MNSWKLNGIAGNLSRRAIIEGLGVPFTQIYKKVKSIDNHGVITSDDGRQYKLQLVEIIQTKENDIFSNKSD